MSRFTLLSIALLAFGVTAFSQTVIDPVGFCATGTTASACIASFPSGSNETISVTANDIVMVKNGSGGSASPWYLLIAVPNNVGGAPTINTITGGVAFSTLPQTGTDEGAFLSTTPPGTSIYDFVNPSITGDSSMNSTNLFGSQEQAAFGSTPTSFEIYEYTFTPDFQSQTAYTINFANALPNGTFLAASGGSNPFSTPFTTTGLVDAPTSVPEPTSVLLLATMGLILGTVYRRRTRLS